jgi:hypothetical protein
MSDSTPKRRWYRWSLRTLFVVVTALGISFGSVAYNLNWIRQRHQALQIWTGLQGPSTSAPGMLWIFGEPGYEVVVKMRIPRTTKYPTGEDRNECNRMQALFPEASVLP